MARVQRVLIVGGGIAGLSAAIGLRKAGISVDIVEIKKEWTVYHVGIIVLSNFIRAMVALGIADRCVAIGFPYEGLRFYDAHFRVLAEPGNSRFPDEKLHELLRERLRGFGGVIATIRDNYITDPTKAVYRPLEAFLMPPPWYRGRVLLIGDAAHATTPHLGQGAAQAVEDAVVLAELLAKDAPMRELLDAFMKRRYERNKFVVESSVQIGEWEQHPTPDTDFIGLTAKSGEVTAQPI